MFVKFRRYPPSGSASITERISRYPIQRSESGSAAIKSIGVPTSPDRAIVEYRFEASYTLRATIFMT